MIRGSLVIGIACAALILPFAAGCSSADDGGAETDSSDLTEANKRQAEDLFRPADSTLVRTIPATAMAGLAEWRLYDSPRGVTVRGVSASGKIKVVYVIAFQEQGDASVKVKSAGYVKATDFALPEDAMEAMAEIGEAIDEDVAAADGDGLEAQAMSCRSGGMHALITVVGGALTVGGAAVVGTVCVATAGAGCVLGGMILAIAGTSTVVENFTTPVCPQGQ